MLGWGPALTQAAISLRGKPSLVIAPLNTLTATGCPSSVACEITPEAPSPSCRPICRRLQSICAMPAPSSAATSRVSLNGLPAQASQLRRGNSCSHAGSAGRRLAEMRNSSSFVQRASESGKAVSRLPANISFCSCVQLPSSSGSASMALSVSVSQRSLGGKACAGTLRIRLALKPIMLSSGQEPSTAGNEVNRLSEQNTMRSLCRRGRSSGNDDRALPDKSRISSVSARS